PPAAALAIHSFPTRRSSDLAGTLADGPDPGRTRLEPVVDLDVTPCVQLDAGHVQADPGGVGRPSGGGQDGAGCDGAFATGRPHTDRKSTRLNSSHLGISYAV